jgi:phosphonoacetaldehyde hydrolase
VTRLEAVIFDWAGTTVDCGSLAPVRAVTRLFADHGIDLSDADIRRDMGLFKKDHIRRILALPHVDREWNKKTGRSAAEPDVEALFAEFLPLQTKVLEEYSHVICGIPAVVETLRSRGLKLGSTTGYTRPMLDILTTRAAVEGFVPDLAFCPDDVGGGRPLPWMCWRIALEFRLSSTAAAVKLGDTISDIDEGRNAGMWTIGVAATGNEVGLNASELASLAPEDRQQRVERARRTLSLAGAHYVIDSVAELAPVIEEINQRLAAGERP